MNIPNDRQRLEGNYTGYRILELRLNPIQENFDAAHLREINRRIFQDLPKLGFDDVTPGVYRTEVPAGKDWIKRRRLETIGISACVAYSSMNKATKDRLDDILKTIKPNELSKLNTDEFTKSIGKLYVQLDYIHPFSDGNSRTLREFTRQLAQVSGYKLDWERFSKEPVGRDLLCIARDLSVNELALPHIQNASNKRDVVFSMDLLEGNRKLPDLLQDAIHPDRAVAFAQTNNNKFNAREYLNSSRQEAAKNPALHNAVNMEVYIERKLRAQYHNDPAAVEHGLNTARAKIADMIARGVEVTTPKIIEASQQDRQIKTQEERFDQKSFTERNR